MFRIIATIGAIQVFAIVVGLIRSKVMALLLGPEGLGVVSVVDQVVQLVAQISALSLPFAAVKFLSLSHSQGATRFAETFAVLFRVLLILTSIGTAIALAAFWAFSDVIDPKIVQYLPYLIPGLLSIPAIALHGFFGSVVAAVQRARLAALFSIFITISLTISSYVGLTLAGIGGFYWANLIASVFIVIVFLFALRKQYRLPVLNWRSSIQAVVRQNPDILKFSLILYGTTFTFPLSYLVARYAVLTRYSEGDAGLLQAALTLAGALSLILNPANGLYLTPSLNRNLPVETKIRSTVEFQRKLVLLIGVLSLPMVLFPRTLLILMFSNSFVQVSQLIFVLVIAQVIRQLAGIYQALLIGVNDLLPYGISTVVGHLTFAGLSWLLVPLYGIWGVAWAFTISAVLLFCLTLGHLLLKYRFRIQGSHIALIGYLLLVLTVAGAWFGPADDRQWLVLGGKLATYIVFTASLLLFLTRAEYHWATQQAERVFGAERSRRWVNRMDRIYTRLSGIFLS